MSRLTRGVVVVGLLVGCLALIAVTRPLWLSASLAGAGPGGSPVRITPRGNELVSVVPTAAIVVAACGAALTLARGVARYLVLALAGLAAAGCLVSVGSVVADPRSAARSLLAEKAGVTTDSIGSGVVVQLALWPYLAIVVALLVLLWALAGVVASRSWGQRGADSAPTTATGHPPDDPASAWDSLSQGNDPTT